MKTYVYDVNNLKSGYVVEITDGTKLVVADSKAGKVLVSDHETWLGLNQVSKNPAERLFIVKVYGLATLNIDSITVNTMSRELLWEYKPERKKLTVEEIEKALGYPIEIVSGGTK